MTNKRPPSGLRLRAVNARGDQELPVMFGDKYEDTPESRHALGAVAQGEHGRLVVTGRYALDAFQAESVDFIPTSEERTIDEIWCPLVVEALKQHLKNGDPYEPILHDGKNAWTAQRVLEMLISHDPKALRFIEDVHAAALSAVRVRRRKPKPGLGR